MWFPMILLSMVLADTPGTRTVLVPEAPAPVDGKVEGTMLRMRLLGVVLEDGRRQAGSYPAADGHLHPVADVVRKPGLEVKDAWGEAILYQANAGSYELISLGSNKHAEIDHAQRGAGNCGFHRVADAPDPADDLVLRCGVFTRRPFGPYAREFTTLNNMTTIALAVGDSSSIAGYSYGGIGRRRSRDCQIER